MAVGALVGVGVLLSRVGDPEVFWDTVKDADWWFVALAFVLGIATDVAFGITFLGNVPIRLPVWPSIELQSAMSFSNLAVPVAADTALQVRFLQKNGLDLGSSGRGRRDPQLGVGDHRAGRAAVPRHLARARLDRLRPHRHQPDRGGGAGRRLADRRRRWR